MAKYSRFDSRNKKRNKHKNQYLDRAKSGVNDKRPRCFDEDETLYEKYRLEKFSNLY